jgi:hypothetical protein
MHSIEPLETRIAPAVTATFVAGILTITGDNGNNDVTVTEQAIPSSYHVTGLTSGITDFTGVLSIVANLRDGEDSLSLVGDATAGTVLAKDVSVTAKGLLSVSLSANVNIKGSLKVEHGGGPNTPDLAVSVQGAGLTVGQILVNDGQGNSIVNIGTGARILKGVTIHGGGGDGNDSATFSKAFVGGTILKTDDGNGSDQLSIFASYVGGAVTFLADSDSPNFSIQSGSAVKGAVNVGYTGGGAGTATIAGFLGSVSVTAAGSNDTVTFGAANIFGKVALKLGDGDNTVSYGSSDTGGGFTVLGGVGLTSVTLTTGSQIHGTLAVTAPLSASLSVSISEATIGGKLTLLGGAGGDTLAAVSSTVTGGILATLGGGSNNATVDTISSFAGITIITGAGDDTITAVNLELRTLFSANVGAGPNSVSVRGSVGGVKLTGGAGNDTFELHHLLVRGVTILTGGTGNDIVVIDDGLFGGAFTFNAGAGDNIFDIEKVTGIDDDVNTIFMGTLTYLGGANNDTVFLGLDSSNAAIALAPAKFIGGLGSNTLNDNFLFALSTFAAPGFTVV